MGGEPSKQGDVHSFGILVLEMFTGRRPTDEMFKDDFNIHNFVKMALPEKLVQIVDSSLLTGEVEEITMSRDDGRSYNNKGGIEVDSKEGNLISQKSNQISFHLRKKCLVSVLHIGLACSEESPNERMNMGDVIKELQHIKDAYMGNEIHGERQRTS
ncbi:Protein kinase-like domain containing protein [Trema orientale]|uniref:Protein kinase-like domain containing protein n=1 Tax=Trema orientale TaxID=63057 RepID=A0A2P5FBQ4_TREOI|nr:Protein kinase-like domain containing protein [Trema orientale]